MHRALFSLLLLSFVPSAFAAQVIVGENDIQAVLRPMLNGTVTQVTIAWPSFVAADQTAVQAGSLTVKIPDTGYFIVSLTSNAGLSTPAPYTFTFLITKPGSPATTPYSAQITVPISGTPLSLSQTTVVAPWWHGPPTSGGFVPNPVTLPSGGSSGNATSLQGIALSATALQNGQTYVYDSNAAQLIPVAVPIWKKYSISYTQLTGFSTNNGSVTLFARANRQKLCGVSLYDTSAFTAPGLTSLSVTVGDSNGTDNQYTPIAFSVRDIGSVDFNVMGAAVGSGNVRATFTSAGALLSALTAGAVDVIVCTASQP